MKVVFVFCVVFFLYFHVQGQSILPQLFAPHVEDPNLMASAQDKIDQHVNYLSKKKHHSEKAFLKYVFQHTHRSFLHTYSPYSPFWKLIDHGEYNCLTGTALFSVVLQKLNFRFHLIETHYHIFLIVHLSTGDVLLETTDRIGGLIFSPKKIQNTIHTYQKNERLQSPSGLLSARQNLYKEVDMSELPGLLFFNRAVVAFNRGSLNLCSTLLAQATSYYNSPRINELQRLVQIKKMILYQYEKASRSSEASTVR